jgi:hypothetical protein
MTSPLGTPSQADSSYGSGEHDLGCMGSMVQFHQKMVKDAEEQKPFVAIVARLIAKLVDNNDKACCMLQLARIRSAITRFLLQLPSDKEITVFHAQKAPAVNVVDYAER